MSNPEFHPACLVFPPLVTAEFESLVADIAAHGLIHPIVMLDGKVLDGRNRLLACRQAGVQPRFTQWRGTGSPLAWAISWQGCPGDRHWFYSWGRSGRDHAAAADLLHAHAPPKSVIIPLKAATPEPTEHLRASSSSLSPQCADDA